MVLYRRYPHYDSFYVFCLEGNNEASEGGSFHESHRIQFSDKNHLCGPYRHWSGAVCLSGRLRRILGTRADVPGLLEII